MSFKKKKFIVCVIMALCACLFAGCEAGIDLYEAQGEDGWYFLMNVSVDRSLENALEKDAAHSDRHGKKWTVQDWLCDYFALTSEMYGYEYTYDGVRNENGMRVYGFYDIFVPNETLREDLSDGLTLSGDTEVSTNLFMRTINVVRDDRFNYFIREYERELDEGDSSHGGSTLMGMILYGCGHYESVGGETVYVEDLPGFGDAFPTANVADYEDVLLTDFWLASKKMNVDCRARINVQDSRNVYYVFQKEAGDGDTDVRYEYFRADPTGWYIAAVAAGFAAVGLAILAARAIGKRSDRKPKPNVKDYFPYDPSKIDPFADDNPFGDV